MRILYLNPNSTAAMTASMLEVAREAVPGHEVLGWTNEAGPPAIQGPEDGAVVVPQLLALLPAAEEAGAEAIVISRRPCRALPPDGRDRTGPAAGDRVGQDCLTECAATGCSRSRRVRNRRAPDRACRSGGGRQKSAGGERKAPWRRRTSGHGRGWGCVP
ncbi:aspartate/glutamate racemase family protein [Mangrovicoccus ximenensis]|uniref:aspartate/glutamate racemase family protein n=1 Tax=Mangrovicoccus ximenensis TaxID=1911570 RepID=UPI000D33DCC2